METSPEIFLSHPAVLGIAPWCRHYGTVELALMLVPPMPGIGIPLTRGELGRRAVQLGRALVNDALGQFNYQRINRAVAYLAKVGILAAQGRGPRRGFVVTPIGFAVLMLNLRALRQDPLIDPSEFEIRRELAAVWWSLARVLENDTSNPTIPGEMSAFYEAVDAVTIGGETFMSVDLVQDTLSMQRLIARQRHHVQQLRRRLDTIEVQLNEFASLERLATVAPNARHRDAPIQQVIERAWTTAQLELPRQSLRTHRSRYDRYLDYLKDLETIYPDQSDAIPLAAYRKVARAR